MINTIIALMDRVFTLEFNHVLREANRRADFMAATIQVQLEIVDRSPIRLMSLVTTEAIGTISLEPD